MIVEMEIYSGK